MGFLYVNGVSWIACNYWNCVFKIKFINNNNNKKLNR